VAKTRDELLRVTRHSARYPAVASASAGGGDNYLLKFALLAYPDRVCRRRESDPSAGVMVGGGGVRLAPESIVRAGDYFVAVDARVDDRSATREALVRIGSAVHMQWLEELFPQSIRTERFATYEPSRRRAVGRMRVRYRDLVLRDVETGDVYPAAAEAALREALMPKAVALVAEDEQLAPLMLRLSFLQHALPAHLWPKNGWSPFDVAELVAEACVGAVTLDDVKRNVRHVAEAKLTHEVKRLLNEHAPEALTVPSGNRIRLDWSAAGVEPLRGPVLSVRLQELFGWTDTPRVAGGRVPVRLELLGPNYRPVQVTDDLRNFWANTYFQVRKDLRARYPKHSWPEDPLTAKAEAKGGRRR
jgi:ATP-dependent helicase HrpB